MILQEGERVRRLADGAHGTVRGQPYNRPPRQVYVRWDGTRQEDMSSLECEESIQRLSTLELMAEAAK